MGTCKECRNWEPFTTSGCGISAKGGWCRNINVVDKTLNILPSCYGGKDREEIATHKDFGCVHFEAKSEGAFYAWLPCGSQKKKWQVRIEGGKTSCPMELNSKDDADTICSWLNSLWPK